MLSLTRKTDYALVALAHLRHRQLAGHTATSAREIADQFKMPVARLMNILKTLSKAKIVCSVRGAGGGYTLNVDSSRLTMIEVIVAMEGPLRFATCTDGLPIMGQGCEVGPSCPISGPIRKINLGLKRFFGQVTLDDLLTDGKCFGKQIDVPLSAIGIQPKRDHTKQNKHTLWPTQLSCEGVD